MLMAVMREILTLVGLLTVLVLCAGCLMNYLLFGHWYGETEEQRRARIRQERAKARAAGGDRAAG